MEFRYWLSSSFNILSYFHNFGRMWLVNEFALSFWALKRCAKFQSNPIILSRVIVSTNAGQTTDRKNNKQTRRWIGWIFRKWFLHKTNTFLYEENFHKLTFYNYSAIILLKKHDFLKMHLKYRLKYWRHVNFYKINNSR